MADPKIAELLAKAAELGITDEAVARQLIKANKVRSFKKLGEVIAASKAQKTKAKNGATLRVRKASKVHQEGPRGFRFGPVWLASIKAAKGVALLQSNLPKLKKTADHYGVKYDDNTSQEELVAAVAKAIP